MWWLLVLFAAVIAVATFLMRGHGPVALARFLRRTALTFLCVATVLIGLFVAGETLADPDSGRAAGLLTLWLLLALPAGLLGWRRPVTGGVMLLALGLVPVAVSVTGSGFGAVPLIGASTPPVLTGLLYLLAEIIRRRAAVPGPMLVETTSPDVRQPGPLAAGGTDGVRQHTPGAEVDRRDPPGRGTARRAA